jgi:hypothetical protein
MNERKAVGNGDYEDVPGAPYSTFPIKPHIDGIRLGFRLAYDGDCRLFTGCVHGCQEPSRRLSTYQERGDWRAWSVGFRLVWDKE